MSELTTDIFKKILKEELNQGFENQASLINTAFQGQADHFNKLMADLKNDMDKRFDEVDKRFDKVDDRLKIVETKLDRALYTELVHLEARLRKVEDKVGIKPIKL